MRLTFTATRVISITASARPTGRSWPAVKPALAPSLVHSSARTTPTSTTTALPSHGSNFCRSQPASSVNNPGCAPAVPWPPPTSAFHLANPAWLNRATAATAAIRPANADRDNDGLAPKPTKCAIVSYEPVLRVSHENTNRASIIAAAITEGNHQPGPVTAAVRLCGPDGTSTPCQRSNQPQACASAYSGASARMNVIAAPSRSERMPTSSVALLGAV